MKNHPCHPPVNRDFTVVQVKLNSVSPLVCESFALLILARFRFCPNVDLLAASVQRLLH